MAVSRRNPSSGSLFRKRSHGQVADGMDHLSQQRELFRWVSTSFFGRWTVPSLIARKGEAGVRIIRVAPDNGDKYEGDYLFLRMND